MVPNRAHINIQKKWIQEKGKLGGPGYTTKGPRTRHAIIDKCVKKFGYNSCRNSIQLWLNTTTTTPQDRKIWLEDKMYIMAKYSPREKNRLKAKKKLSSIRKKRSTKKIVKKNPSPKDYEGRIIAFLYRQKTPKDASEIKAGARLREYKRMINTLRKMEDSKQIKYLHGTRNRFKKEGYILPKKR